MANGQNKDSQQLKSNFGSTDNNLQKLQSFLEELDRLLEDTISILEVPKDVSEGLTDLETMLHIIHGLLTGVMVIPPITAPAKTLRTAVANLRRQVKQLRKQANKIEDKIEPHRERLEKMRGYIQKILPFIQTLNMFIQMEAMLLGSADSSNSSLSDSRYKRTQRKELEALAMAVAKTLVKPMKLIVDMLNAVSAIGEALGLITKLCGTLRTILKPLLVVLEELRDLRKPLRVLNKVLEKKIGYKWISVSIRDVFSGDAALGPFGLILKKIANKILEAFLKGLKFNPLSAIPGLGQIIGLMTKTLENLVNIQKIMKVTQPQMTSMFKGKSLETAINKHDV